MKRRAEALLPPQHIKGRMHQHTPPEVREERDKWIAERRTEGYRLREISDAICLDLSSVARIIGERGASKPLCDPMKKPYRFGVYIGAIAPAIRAMPASAQEVLFQKASKTGKTMAEILADHFSASITESLTR